jgi:hypothetical protein
MRKLWRGQMKTPTRGVTIVVSGDYHGPTDQSTDVKERRPGQGWEMKRFPRLIVSDQVREDDRYLLYVNRRLGGKVEVAHGATSDKEPSSSR